MNIAVLDAKILKLLNATPGEQLRQGKERYCINKGFLNEVPTSADVLEILLVTIRKRMQPKPQNPEMLGLRVIGFRV